MASLIGIAGTHSTGKSTFVKNLEEKLAARGKRVRTVHDGASNARDLGFPILRDHTFESTLWIISRVVSLELEAGLNADIVIVDRPVPDALGYLLAALQHRGASLPDAEQEYLFDLVRHHSKRYRCLVKTSLDSVIPLGMDRDEDMKFRQLAADCIDEVFERFSLKHIVLKYGAEVVAEEAVLKLIVEAASAEKA